MTFVGVVCVRVRSEIGTWSAMLWTLKPCEPLTPTAAAEGIR